MNPFQTIVQDDAIEDIFGQPLIGVSEYMADDKRHGTVCVKLGNGRDRHLNFMVDKPHKLIHPTGGTVAYLFEQLEKMGLSVRSIQIDCGEKPQLFQPV